MESERKEKEKKVRAFRMVQDVYLKLLKISGHVKPILTLEELIEKEYMRKKMKM